MSSTFLRSLLQPANEGLDHRRGMFSAPQTAVIGCSDNSLLWRYCQHDSDGLRLARLGKVWQLPADRVGNQRYFDCLSHVEAGGSLIMNEVWRLSTECAVFCDGLEEASGRRVSANYYITPTHSQGFVRHADSHDVIAVQVHGQKTWEVWHNAYRRQVTLIAGDTLHVPRGVQHQAFASSAHSSHLTIGLHDALTQPRTLKRDRSLLDQRCYLPPTIRSLDAALATRQANLPAYRPYEPLSVEILSSTDQGVEVRISAGPDSADLLLSSPQADEFRELIMQPDYIFRFDRRPPSYSLLEWTALLEFAATAHLLRAAHKTNSLDAEFRG